MCNCADSDEPSVFSQKTRKAKKSHKCVECYGVIPIGTKYEYTSGIWDGSPSSFKTCLRCVVLREAHIKAEEAVQAAELEKRWQGQPEALRRGWAEPCRPIFGEVRAAIGECAREEPAYVAEFRKVRKALLAIS